MRLREFNNQWSIQPYEGLEEIINKKLLPSMEKNATMRGSSLLEPKILKDNLKVHDDKPKLRGALLKANTTDPHQDNPLPA